MPFPLVLLHHVKKSVPPPLLLISSVQGPTNPPPSSLPFSPPPAVRAAPLSAALTPGAGTSGHTSGCLARCQCRYRYRMAPTGVLRNLTLVLGAAVVVLGSLLFIAWKLYFRGTEPAGTWDSWELRELQERDPAGSTAVWKQVLVLGLDGAGKSSVLHYICSQKARTRIPPTLGFNSAQLHVGGLEMDLLEVGGSYNLRAYWPLYLSDAHVLVFVVDSVDRSRLLTARQELHTLLAEEPRLPLVVLANKQDKSDALSTEELREELALHLLSGQRELFLLPTSATWASLSTATSILHVKSLLVTLLSQP
ncbi:ADP-ribosylation factor-like protein 10 [Centrocercus urophasianus]|uniref:ADP-ribosylation factor-like protein 10 n=1 Tax=Centrocercus urophasianus TaxID=9002 RepID=UPI001C651998|nr:ADP-ribosylation factor-like protein 10 [Centrocercus urophasianus]